MMNRRSFLGTGALAMLAAGCQSFKCSTAEPARRSGRLPFRFGIAGYTFHRCTLDETLGFMKAFDVHDLCIKDFHLPMKSTDAEIRTFHQKCADHGVTGYAVGPIYMLTDDDAKKAFEYAARVGVKTVVCVPAEKGEVGGRKQNVGSRARCETVARLCAEYDMRAAIHNHGPDIPYCFPTGDSAYEMVRDLDRRLGLCLDIGHNFRAGLDPAASIRKLADRIYDMHVKNVKFDAKKNLAMPMPRGDMNMWEVVKALREVGYSGCCSLEYESFPGKGVKPGIKVDDVAESIGYFKGLMRAAEA